MKSKSLRRRATRGKPFDAAHRNRTPSCEVERIQSFAQAIANAANGGMIFDHEHWRSFADGLAQPFIVEPVEPWHVDDSSRDAFGAQQLRRADSLRQHHGSVAHEQSVSAFLDSRPPSHIEPVIRR